MEQKNKGGRPTKTLSEKRKNQVLLRLNTMEYYTLQGKAREASMSRTEFLRQLITKAEIKKSYQTRRYATHSLHFRDGKQSQSDSPSAQCFWHLCNP